MQWSVSSHMPKSCLNGTIRSPRKDNNSSAHQGVIETIIYIEQSAALVEIVSTSVVCSFTWMKSIVSFLRDSQNLCLPRYIYIHLKPTIMASAKVIGEHSINVNVIPVCCFIHLFLRMSKNISELYVGVTVKSVHYL